MQTRVKKLINTYELRKRGALRDQFMQEWSKSMEELDSEEVDDLLSVSFLSNSFGILFFKCSCERIEKWIVRDWTSTMQDYLVPPVTSDVYAGLRRIDLQFLYVRAGARVVRAAN